MRAFPFLPLLAGFALGRPQAANCETTTEEVIIPTSTATYSTTQVTTIHATTARDLGTFTDVVRVKSTKTLQTLTATYTDCTANGTITTGPTSTIYTAAGDANTLSSPAGPAPYTKRSPLEIAARQDVCTVTSTFTTTFGQTYTFIAIPDETSTFTEYTDFTQASVTSTSYGGTAYAIATASATTEAICGPAANRTATATSTVTRDSRCAPSAMVSAYNGFGLEYSSDTPAGGATFKTNATDASSCCQLCAEADSCAAASWDIRNGACKLEFPVDPESGAMNCGEGLLAYYDAGPNSPMKPGTGLFVAELCGNAEYSNAKPDDGT